VNKHHLFFNKTKIEIMFQAKIPIVEIKLIQGKSKQKLLISEKIIRKRVVLL
jgi:hypothetical protein